MQPSREQFESHLLATLEDLSSPADSSKLRIIAVPEENVKYNSLDDYMRLAVLQVANLENRLFDVRGVSEILSAPNSSYPLWIDVYFDKNTEPDVVNLAISMRFRKPSELKNKETGHPPFKLRK